SGIAGLALVALTSWLPAPISLTPAEKAAIPPTAVALGIVVLCSAALVAFGALTRRRRTTLFGYAVVVMAIPFLSGNLLVAVGEDRSSAAVASATAAALERSGGTSTVLGVLAYAPSLPFYLGRPIAVATEPGRQLTTHSIRRRLALGRPAQASRLHIGHGGRAGSSRSRRRAHRGSRARTVGCPPTRHHGPDDRRPAVPEPRWRHLDDLQRRDLQRA